MNVSTNSIVLADMLRDSAISKFEFFSKTFEESASINQAAAFSK